MAAYISAILNNKSYIGLTTRTLKERKLEHLRHLDIENTYFHKAIKKYGKDNFIWEVLNDTANTIEELQELEIKYIKELNTLFNFVFLTFMKFYLYHRETALLFVQCP